MHADRHRGSRGDRHATGSASRSGAEHGSRDVHHQHQGHELPHAPSAQNHGLRHSGTPSGSVNMKQLSTLILAALLCAPAARAQDKSLREALGTRVTASGNSIVLDWDPKHPWRAEMARGATLLAEYPTSHEGTVLQKLTSGIPVAPSATSMRFVLPDHLTVSPAGPVCLMI